MKFTKDSMWGMDGKQTASIVALSAIGLLMVLMCGCASINEAWMRSYVAIHDAADAVLTNSTPTATNPATDTSGMVQAVPLVPYLGADDNAVNSVLFKRWQDGGNDGCGGLPEDTRPLLIRPAGGTFGWKYVITEREANGPNIILDGDYMTVTSGWYKGQFFKFEGKSDKEWDNGKRPTDFEAVKSGVRTLRKHFVSFTAWNKQ